MLVLTGVATALEAWTFNVAFMTDPVGPKALPLLVAGALVVAGARLMARPRSTVQLPDTGPARRMMLAAAAFISYGLVLPWLGFFLSTTIVVGVLGVLFGGPRVGSAVAGAGLSAVLWLLFVMVLSLPLPIGALWIR
jgi:putative tricarboxylic transport membrane protein